MLNIWIGNLGKYNEGELVGGWLNLPKTQKEIDEFLKNVVGLNEEYEEYMINDYETDLPYKVYEFDSIKELNLLAKVAEDIEDLDNINAYVEADKELSKLELMNLIKQEHNIPFYPYDCPEGVTSNDEKYGYTMAEIWGIRKTLEDTNLEMYMDFEKYGRDRCMCANTVLLDDGYIEMDESNIDLELYTLAELIEEYDTEKEKLRIVFKEVGKDPVVMEIEDTLEAKQKLVGGLIEVVPYKEGILLICNEEGKLENLKPNIDIGYDYIAGNCFVVGDDFENAGFKSVTDEQVEILKDSLKMRAIEVIEEETEEDDMEM